ncbi:hypothetical protein CBR_g40193 [Chara braunii]|uniref:Uncharacterized protein n=1 Tax=Chara braunii TaxID=69332 RepID=A0A388LTG9_CHABU|nr:hypothetical protein CBR_g40193 [Chara braunii]|eukprot:GBG85555.1 hypothetical protein CBR_g40193 [Chara braunii]
MPFYWHMGGTLGSWVVFTMRNEATYGNKLTLLSYLCIQLAGWHAPIRDGHIWTERTKICCPCRVFCQHAGGAQCQNCFSSFAGWESFVGRQGF